MALALALLICLGSGAALVSAACPRGFASALALKLSLSVGFGIGLFSILFLVCRVLAIAKIFAADLLVFALLLFVAFLRSKAKGTIELRPAEDPRWPGWLRTVVVALSIALCAAVYNTVVRAIAYPQGEGWDAFAIWNLHARFLFRGGANWRDGFSALIPWSHPDYPLLVPAAIAHFWSYFGRETSTVPTLIGLLFTFSTVGLLFSSLAILRGRATAMLGGLALLSTPFFIEQGTSQYADVPLSFFILATVALLSLQHAWVGNPSIDAGLLVLSGLAACFAAWTKNEGLLFLCALVLVRFVASFWTHTADPAQTQRDHTHWRGLAIFMASVLPGLMLIFWFKHSIVPQGDLFASSNQFLPKLLAPARYWAICKWYLKDFLRFGHWLAVPGTVLLLVLYLFGDRKATRAPHGFATCVLTLAFTLAGYFAIYVITPHEIYWHLRTSLDRLFLQLWPSSIFLFFLQMPMSPMLPTRGQSP